MFFFCFLFLYLLTISCLCRQLHVVAIGKAYVHMVSNVCHNNFQFKTLRGFSKGLKVVSCNARRPSVGNDLINYLICYNMVKWLKGTISDRFDISIMQRNPCTSAIILFCLVKKRIETFCCVCACVLQHNANSKTNKSNFNLFFFFRNVHWVEISNRDVNINLYKFIVILESSMYVPTKRFTGICTSSVKNRYTV